MTEHVKLPEDSQICPFCAAESDELLFSDGGDDDWVQVKRTSCGAEGPCGNHAAEAARLWNLPRQARLDPDHLPPLRLNITFEHEDGQMGKPVITDDLGRLLKGVRGCEVFWEYQELAEISVRLVNNPAYITLGNLKV